MIPKGPSKGIINSYIMKRPEHLRTIGVVAKKESAGIDELLSQTSAWCRARGITLLADSSMAKSCRAKPVAGMESLARKADLLLVLGGDGTLLATARAAGRYQKPILGINLGSMGYLTEFTTDELFPALETIWEGRHQIQERVMLAVEMIRGKGLSRRYLALNDAVIHNGVLARIMDLDISVDGHFVNHFRSDGLIISTPTGSTAYSLSAGGPILQPDLGAFILTPICPHTLSNRPIVLKDTVCIQVELKMGGNAMLTIDGQVGEPMVVGDSIRLCKASYAARLVKPPNKNHFLILRQKLRWGEP